MASVSFPTATDVSVHEFAVDTGAALSGVSEETLDAMRADGVILHQAGRFYVIPEVWLDDQPVTDLRFRVSKRLSEVGAPGILGLDFLGRFNEVCFERATMTLSLRS